jgi:ABC-type sugar transport system ATPase subunit
LIGDLSRKGTAVLLITSELPELMALAHRIIVLHKGKAVTEFLRPDFDPRAIIEYAASATEDSVNV